MKVFIIFFPHTSQGTYDLYSKYIKKQNYFKINNWLKTEPPIAMI